MSESPHESTGKENAEGTPPSLSKRQRLLVRTGLLAFAVLAWIVIWPDIGSFQRKVLVEGIVRWHGKPLKFVFVTVYPVLHDGTLGEPAITESSPTSGDGRFTIITWRSWRSRYPSPREIVLKVDAPDDLIGDSREDFDRITRYEDPETSPLRIHIEGTGSDFLRIELSTGTIEATMQADK